ncbi:MAG: phage tail protein [Lachnospiraceae bacterium]|nr:phage tail protein [Lachnospiraceae bacterium]
MPRYTIRKNRIKQSGVSGFELLKDGSLRMNENEMFHGIFLRGIDSTEDESGWGRLSFKFKGSEESQVYAYVLATDHRDRMNEAAGQDIDRFFTDESVGVQEKIALLKRSSAKRFVGMTDCLLYDLKGRYLFAALEVVGEGDACISDIVIDSTGDNFMETYPEVYRERNSFFHRYISIFSTIYNDFQQDIANIHKILDLDLCTEEQLIIYGNWMGMDLKGGFLDTEVLRQLVKEGYSLNRMKGTRRAMERILEIILGEKAVFIEHNLVRAWHKEEEDSEMLPNFKARGIYDVTILVKKRLTEDLRYQILYILDQYKPIRTRISIAQLDETPTADSSSYLDVNTTLPEEKSASLDEELSMDGIVVLR